MTVEDPIEFLHPHKRAVVNQREVGEDTHSFAAALKHVLRQDPDVILVGEMRDLETIHDRAHRGRDRPPRVRAPCTPRTRRSRSTASSTCSPPHQQQQIRVQLAASLQGIVHPAALPDRRRHGPGRRRRGARRHPGGPQPHPGGQDPPDLLDDAGRREVRHGHDGPVARRARAGRARSRSRSRSSAARTRKTSAASSSSRAGRPDARRPSPTRSATRAGKLVEGSLEADDAEPRRRQAAPDGLRAHRHRAAERQVAQRATSRSRALGRRSS